MKLIKIDDIEFKLEVPAGYSDISRLTYKDGKAGVYGTNLHGKRLFFPARRTFVERYGKKTSN